MVDEVPASKQTPFIPGLSSHTEVVFMSSDAALRPTPRNHGARRGPRRRIFHSRRQASVPQGPDYTCQLIYNKCFPAKIMTSQTKFEDRYSRQILFRGIGAEGQKKLGQGRVVIVGCGATG